MAGVHTEPKTSLRNGFQNLAGIIRSLDPHLASDLERLGQLLYVDMDSGLSQLRDGLPRILQKRTSLEKAGDCTPFLEAYRSPKGKALSNESVHRLAALASTFPSGEEASRKEVELEKNYGADPKSFWYLLSPPQDSSTLSIIRHISESFDEQESLNPIRRRIILSILFERVQSLSHQFQAHGNKLQPGQTYKGVINEVLLNNLWDNTNKSTKRKRQRFCRNVRAGGNWNRLEPGVLIGLAHQQAWTTWERSMKDDELEAISTYIESLPSYQRWKGLSPFVLKLKSAFLCYHTEAGGHITQNLSVRRTQAKEHGDSHYRNRQRRKRRAEWSSFHVPGDAQDATLTQSSSQPHILVSQSDTVSDMNGSLHVLAEVATTTGSVSSEYSPPLVDASFMNDFNISAGPVSVPQPPPLVDVSFMNDFDISAGPVSVPQLPPFGDASFTNGTNHFDISAGLPPPLGHFFVGASRDFDLLTGQPGAYHQDSIDGSSFGNGMNEFDISAGQENVLDPIGDARFQQLIDPLFQ